MAVVGIGGDTSGGQDKDARPSTDVPSEKTPINVSCHCMYYQKFESLNLSYN